MDGRVAKWMQTDWSMRSWEDENGKARSLTGRARGRPSRLVANERLDYMGLAHPPL